MRSSFIPHGRNSIKVSTYYMNRYGSYSFSQEENTGFHCYLERLPKKQLTRWWAPLRPTETRSLQKGCSHRQDLKGHGPSLLHPHIQLSPSSPGHCVGMPTAGADQSTDALSLRAHQQENALANTPARAHGYGGGVPVLAGYASPVNPKQSLQAWWVLLLLRGGAP